jgi:PleD family two-component response regulator
VQPEVFLPKVRGIKAAAATVQQPEAEVTSSNFRRRHVWRHDRYGSSMHQTRRILIGEDDPHLCRYLVTLLDRKNCEIAVEHNGEDAIRRAASFQPDVALVGFVMPGMDGSTTGLGF